ncbi:C40 family peptidase [Mucilaginibacter sp. CSA2-8R]|uniref:C40 family peptidase n=1 Tax=Mucilaginibacter sp. CSA2-8R TaxID=3141542 RepID=UPI00315D667C
MKGKLLFMVVGMFAGLSITTHAQTAYNTFQQTAQSIVSNSVNQRLGNSSAFMATSSVRTMLVKTDTLINGVDTVYHFNTTTVTPDAFVAYALSLKGTPYVYGSTDPAIGLDCSGLVTAVFNFFNIAVPRRTVDFKNAEKKISIEEAKPGDIVLFTGSDVSLRKPGHMGIVTSVGKDIEFVHASSGQTCAVTTGKLSYSYFKTRLLDIVRVF